MAAQKMTKNQMRRAKRKDQKKLAAETAESTPAPESTETDAATDPEKVAVESLAVKLEEEQNGTIDQVDSAFDAELDNDDPAYVEYQKILRMFGPNLEDDEITKEADAGNKGTIFFGEDDDIPDEEEEQGPTQLSKKKRKKLNKLSIAELKALVRNPEVVEWNDPSSSDPRLLVQVKAQRNIVPVPPHWSLKREYLSSKRGIEKPPFQLPAFIAETGITEMRDAVLEKQAEQTLKQKQRERVQPKMGKLDIDYQRLYDAFFRFQTKPDLTRFGDVYYEGKEWEADFRYFKPGEVSDSLREALGMQPGFPPPWLLQQQRMGPPVSYPTLKIPGLNAPIPAGASWGFGPGQWGKPPVDEYNRPIYGGDIFGVTGNAAGGPGGAGQMTQNQSAPVDRTRWGELQPPEEESEEEEESDEEEEEEDADEDGDNAPAGGILTEGGYASTVLPSGINTHAGAMAGGQDFDIRKQNRGVGTETDVPQSLYTVIPERESRVEGFFGSDKTYALPTHQQQNGSSNRGPVLGQEDDASRKRKKPGDVDVALDPDGDMSKAELERRYKQSQQETGIGAQWQGESLDDMIAENSHKRAKREQEKGKFRF